MDISEGRRKFIEQWGKMGSEWGVSRCMTQIHALLMISPEPLCADRIMEELCISRGSVNTNLRTLIEWGLVKKKLIPGERKEFFIGEKDLWVAFKRIIENRRKRELKPLISELEQLQNIEGDSEEVREYKRVVSDLSHLFNKADSALDILLELNESWLKNRDFSFLS